MKALLYVSALALNFATQATLRGPHSCEIHALITTKTIFPENRQVPQAWTEALDLVSNNLTGWEMVNEDFPTPPLIEAARSKLDEIISRELSPSTQRDLSPEIRTQYFKGYIQSLKRGLSGYGHSSSVVPVFQWFIGNFANSAQMPFLRLEHEYIHARLQRWGDLNSHQACAKLDTWLLLNTYTPLEQAFAVSEYKTLYAMRRYLGPLLIFSSEVEVAQIMLAHYSAWRKNNGAPGLLWSEFSTEGEERYQSFLRGTPSPAYSIFLDVPPVLVLQRYISMYLPKAKFFSEIQTFLDLPEATIPIPPPAGIPEKEWRLAGEIREMMKMSIAKLHNAGFQIDTTTETLQIPSRQDFYNLSVPENDRLPLLHPEDFVNPEGVRKDAVAALSKGSFATLNTYLESLLAKKAPQRTAHPLYNAKREARADENIDRKSKR